MEASKTSGSSSSAMGPPTSSHLLVNENQRGNPLLNYIKNVKISMTKDIIPDYVMHSTCALFISVKYHFRHPKYIIRRIDEVGRNYRLRILLVLVDDDNNMSALTEFNKIAFSRDFSLIFAWSNMECARYLETWKSYENKSATAIQAREETEFVPKLTSVLTNIRSINRTDVSTLMDVFGNLKQITQASEEQLVMCPGLGEKKVKRLFRIFHEPFQKKVKKSSSSSGTEAADICTDLIEENASKTVLVRGKNQEDKASIEEFQKTIATDTTSVQVTLLSCPATVDKKEHRCIEIDLIDDK